MKHILSVISRKNTCLSGEVGRPQIGQIALFCMFDVNEASVCAFDDCMCMEGSLCVFVCVHEDQECTCVCACVRASERF